MANEYIKLFADMLEGCGALSDEEFGRLVRALLSYQRTGAPASLTGNEQFLFPVYRAQLDREREHYTSQCRRNAENGKRGGRPKSEQNRKNPVGFSQSEKSQEKEKEKDKEEEKEKEYTPQSPQGGGFDQFWAIYPRKVGKQAALKSWSKLKPDGELTQRILHAVEYQKTWPQWRKDDGQYIPNPATWLNQGRWEDELSEGAKGENGDVHDPAGDRGKAWELTAVEL